MVHKIIVCFFGLSQFGCFNSNFPKHSQIAGVWISIDFKDSIEQGVLPCLCNHDFPLAYIIFNIANDTFSIRELNMNNDNIYFISRLKGGSIEYNVTNHRFKFKIRDNDTLEVNYNRKSYLFLRSQFEIEVGESLRLGALTYKYFLPFLDTYDISPAMDTFLIRSFNSFECRDDLGGINLLTGKTTKLLVEIQNDTLQLYDIVLPKTKSYPINVKKRINSRWLKKK
jgi:hypothetical protein